MDQKALINTAITAAATLVVTLGITWVVTRTDEGIDAAEKARIEAVVTKMLLTDTGQTHGAALAVLGTGLNGISIKVDGIEKDISDMREALFALASE